VYRFSDEAVLVQDGPAIGGSCRGSWAVFIRAARPSSTIRLRIDPACEGRPPSQESARRHFRRQRHGQHDLRNEVQRQIRESEILVYAVGIDAHAETGRAAPSPVRPRFPPIQLGSRFLAAGERPAGACPVNRCRRRRPARACRPLAGGESWRAWNSRNRSTKRRFAP